LQVQARWGTHLPQAQTLAIDEATPEVLSRPDCAPQRIRTIS